MENLSESELYAALMRLLERQSVDSSALFAARKHVSYGHSVYWCVSDHENSADVAKALAAFFGRPFCPSKVSGSFQQTMSIAS